MELTIDIPCTCCKRRPSRLQASRLKSNILGAMMIINFLIYILIEVTRSSDQGRSGSGHLHVTSKRFWKPLVPSKAYWNQKQDNLDHLYNPLFFSALNVSNTSAPELPDDDVPCKPDLSSVTQITDYNFLPQRFKDFLQYMHCRSYPMLINAPAVCSEKPFLLLVVKSLVPHFDRRQAIRQSWGRRGFLNNHQVATVFLLGKTEPSDYFPNLSDMLRYEASVHGDLLQWDYRDTFFNLTLKEVLFLDWLTVHCPSADYIFKGDDDVFVNTKDILKFLGGLSGTKAQDLFVGDVISNATPLREKTVKYYIPESIFMGSYPPYAGGGGYLYSGDVALRLRNASRQVLLYPIDDVYTGMCLQKLGLVPQKHKGFRTFNIDEKYKDNACAYQSLMLVHPRSPQEMIQIWGWINDPLLVCN